MFKKTFFVSTAALLLCFLASCSLFNSPDNSGSVKLILSRTAARNADSGSETLYVDVSLKGDYSQTQTISLPPDATEATAIFDQIKLNATVYIEANVYKKDSASDEKIYTYTGKSDTIKIKSGENNISLTLKKLYSVSFNLNGGTGDFETQRIVSGETATEPETEPTKEATEDFAYVFSGWYKSIDDETPFDFNTPIEESITLYAKWITKQWFTVTFKSDIDADEDFDTTRVLEGNKVSAPETNPTKAETAEKIYTFDYWATADNETFDFDTPVTGNLTLYAHFSEKNIYTVTFYADTEAASAFATDKVIEGNKVKAPASNPTKADTTEKIYTFDCWVTADDETFDFDTPINSNITLYAHFSEKNIYTVTFDSTNGAESAFATEKVVEGNKVKAPASNPAKADTDEKVFSFDCWVTADDEAFDFDTPITGNITLYARYTEKNIYTVTFDSDNGATSAFATEKVIEGNKVSRPETNPVRTDTEDEKYQFDGWYTSKGTAFDFNTEITDNITLIAHYAVTHIYKVSFNLNGGEGTFETQRITEGEKATRPSTEPTRENTATAEYTFGGWYTSTDNGETISDEPFDFDTPITGNLTLYAFWNSTEKFTVSFNVNGGTGNFESQIVTNGDKATEPTTQPTKEDDENTKYTFTGWYTSSDEGKTLSETPFNFTNTKITKDTVLYAGWKTTVAGKVIEVEIPADAGETITVDNSYEDGSYTFTASVDVTDEAYTWSFTWLFEGSETGNEKSFTVTSDMFSGTGYYSVALLAIRTTVSDGTKQYYSYQANIKINQEGIK